MIDADTSGKSLLVQVTSTGGEFHNNDTIRFKIGLGDRNIGYKDRLIRAKAVYYANNWHLESIFPVDITPHFVDVVIDELPYIACKQNASGRKIIDRIPITVPVGGIQSYKVDPAELQSQNYFFPITLSQLSIKLFTDKDNLIKSSDEQHSLEFEITMLKNNTFR